LVYRHRQFPPRYRAGVFAACWSTGVIYFVPFSARGSTVEGEAERFLSPAGNDGFAPVDLAVAPNGDLFVAIGGRGTQGQVLRVRFTGRAAVTTTAGTDLQQVLAADQPLSSWSRARWMPRAKAGEFYFTEDGRFVFTQRYHLRRGYCCGNGCRHCPFDEEGRPRAEVLESMAGGAS
jgi:hypothetical protein